MLINLTFYKFLKSSSAVAASVFAQLVLVSFNRALLVNVSNCHFQLSICFSDFQISFVKYVRLPEFSLTLFGPGGGGVDSTHSKLKLL